MMHKVIFYPVGNGDTSQIVLANGKRLLFDFRHQNQGEEGDSPHIDLKKRLTDELKEAKRDYFDVVAFTHGDKDHIAHSTEFFELQHAKKYQGDGRIKIKKLWVPASMILDTATREQQSNEFVIWRQEARYRLKQGRGIQVFSKPDKLRDWLKQNGLTLESRKHLITDAGSLARGFSLATDQVEFFCHSPFIKHCDEGDQLRNEAALIFQVRFEIGGMRYNYFAIGDSEYDVLEDIVRISKFHKNDDRLDWDLLNIPHHCSSKALAKEKGAKETIPTALVKELLCHGRREAYMVSSSHPIKDDAEAYKQVQPPHIQAKKAYQRYLNKVRGRDLLVTMEEPSTSKPKPLVFEISSSGGRLARRRVTGAAIVTSSQPPRAG